MTIRGRGVLEARGRPDRPRSLSCNSATCGEARGAPDRGVRRRALARRAGSTSNAEPPRPAGPSARPARHPCSPLRATEPVARTRRSSSGVELRSPPTPSRAPRRRSPRPPSAPSRCRPLPHRRRRRLLLSKNCVSEVGSGTAARERSDDALRRSDFRARKISVSTADTETADRVGDLGVRPPLELAHDEGGALIERQTPERAAGRPRHPVDQPPEPQVDRRDPRAELPSHGGLRVRISFARRCGRS